MSQVIIDNPFALASDFERPPSQEEDSAKQPSTSGSPRPSIYDLIWHATDSSVKPIVANRRIERLPEPKWDARALPFKPLVSFAPYASCRIKIDIMLFLQFCIQFMFAKFTYSTVTACSMFSCICQTMISSSILWLPKPKWDARAQPFKPLVSFLLP